MSSSEHLNGGKESSSSFNSTSPNSYLNQYLDHNSVAYTSTTAMSTSTATMSADSSRNAYPTDIHELQAANGATPALDMFADLPPEFDLMINEHDLDGSKDLGSGIFMDSAYLPSSYLGGTEFTATMNSSEFESIPENPANTQSIMSNIQQSVKPVLKSTTSMPNIKPTSNFLQSSLPPKPDPPPNTRKRIPPEKTLILESSFQENPKPDRDSRDSLARETGLPVRNIQVRIVAYIVHFRTNFFRFGFKIVVQRRDLTMKRELLKS